MIKKILKVVNSLFQHIKMLSDWNIDYTNAKLKNLDDNFNVDPPFILAVVGSEFSKLKDIKKEDKKEFLSELSTLIDKFSNINPVSNNAFEMY